MKTIEYLGKTYVVHGSMGAPVDAIFLDSLSAEKLVELRNLLASGLDLGRPIKMFQSKAKGIAAVAGLLVKWDVTLDAEEAEAEKEAIEAEASPAEVEPKAEVEPTKSAPTGPTISVADLIRHDFEEEDVEIVNREWPDGIPATEASVKRAFGLGMDGGVFRRAIDATVPKGKVRDGSKQAALIDLLKRPEGASIKEIVEALNWLPHTTRGAISRDVKKRLGYTVTTSKVEGRGRVYQIES